MQCSLIKRKKNLVKKCSYFPVSCGYIQMKSKLHPDIFLKGWIFEISQPRVASIFKRFVSFTLRVFLHGNALVYLE